MIGRRTFDVVGLRIAHGSADDEAAARASFGASTNISTVRVEAPARRG
jgi:hypothetical protein